ncbi:uncharacterized protein LOC144416236 [Styela clava]
MHIGVNLNMRKIAWTIIVVFVSILKTVRPQDETTLYDGYLFERFDTQMLSSDAEKQCTVRGAWLFEPKTDEMFNELTNSFIPAANDKYYFMGLRKLGGDWRWSDYSEPTTTHW